MMHRPWSSIVEVPHCFSRSNVKFQGHTALKIVKFYRNWAFLDSNASLNSLMVMKCCTKLETAKERCPIVFQSHPSNFKVTRDKTSPLLTRIWRFRTIGRSQLSNPSDLPCFKSHWKIQCVYLFPVKVNQYTGCLLMFIEWFMVVHLFTHLVQEGNWFSMWTCGQVCLDMSMYLIDEGKNRWQGWKRHLVMSGWCQF